MKKIAVVTDSNSGIKQADARLLGIFVIPMPFYIDGKLYFEDITLSQEQFYNNLTEGAEISTSQPAPGDVLDMWEGLLKEYDEIVHIPMSSGLSSTCETATMLASEFDGRVQVVDNQRISVTQRQSVLDAMELVKAGKSALEIKNILEEVKFESSIYITLDTLKYLKKGGRITPAAAAIGSVLNIKPVLQIQGDKLDAYSKCRGKKQAKKIMIDAMKKDMEERFGSTLENQTIHLEASYAGNEEEANEWKNELSKEFPGFDIHMDPLSLSIACHIGHGALAIACSKKLQIF